MVIVFRLISRDFSKLAIRNDEKFNGENHRINHKKHSLIFVILRGIVKRLKIRFVSNLKKIVSGIVIEEAFVVIALPIF